MVIGTIGGVKLERRGKAKKHGGQGVTWFCEKHGAKCCWHKLAVWHGATRDVVLTTNGKRIMGSAR